MCALNTAIALSLIKLSQMKNEELDKLFESRNYYEIARFVINSNNGRYRNKELIDRLKSIENEDMYNLSPLCQYLQAIIKLDKLNGIESIELCKIYQFELDFIQNLIRQDSLTFTEELGDIFTNDPMIAYSIYERANATNKINVIYAVLGMYNKLNIFNLDWIQIINDVISLYPKNLQKILNFIANKGNPLANRKDIVNALIQNLCYEQSVQFLIISLPNNLQEESEYQTLLFDLAISYVPNIALSLYNQKKYTYYDHHAVANFFENFEMFEQAIELYKNTQSIKRCIIRTDKISVKFMLKFFDSLNSNMSLLYMKEILSQRKESDKDLILNISRNNLEKIGPLKILKLLDEFFHSHKICQFLSTIIDSCKEDPDVYLWYIKKLILIGNYKQVVQICLYSELSQPKRILNYFIEEDIRNKIPVISIAIRFGFIEEITKYFYEKEYYIELQKIVQLSRPSLKIGERVLEHLFKMGVDFGYIKRILPSICKSTSILKIFKILVDHNCNNLLNDILQPCKNNDTIDPEIHSVYAIQSVLNDDDDAELIINNDMFYEPKLVGDFLTKYHPYFACIAYAKGNLDNEFIELTSKYKFFDLQVNYCFRRQSVDLWTRILSNENKLYIADIIISNIQNIRIPDKAIDIINVFKKSNIQQKLLDLLDKIIFHTALFQKNSFMETMLISTSIQVDQSRVMAYINSLNYYYVNQIGQELINAKLYDEAIAAYNKFNLYTNTSNVIFNYKKMPKIDSIKDYMLESNDSNFEKKLLQKLFEIFEITDLNAIQTTELCRYILSRNKTNLTLKWNKKQELKISNNSTIVSQPPNTTGVKYSKIKFLDCDDMEEITKIKLIGRGGSSEVHQISKEKSYALKTLISNPQSPSYFNDFQRLQKEYENINIINSPYVIKTYGIFVGDENTPASILMKLYPSSLDKEIKKLGKSAKIRIIEDICKGMIDIHSKGIVHCDLKPQNILLTKKNLIRISDFGSSNSLEDLNVTSDNIEGTLTYIAPERTKGGKGNEKIDVYAFGIILYFILTNGEVPKRSLSDIMNGKIKNIPEIVNEFSRDLINKCIAFDPNERPSFEEIFYYLLDKKSYNFITEEVEEEKKKT